MPVHATALGHLHHLWRNVQAIDVAKPVRGQTLARQAGAAADVQDRRAAVVQMEREQVGYLGRRQVVESGEHGLIVGFGPVAVQRTRFFVAVDRIGALKQLRRLGANPHGHPGSLAHRGLHSAALPIACSACICCNGPRGHKFRSFIQELPVCATCLCTMAARAAAQANHAMAPHRTDSSHGMHQE